MLLLLFLSSFHLQSSDSLETAALKLHYAMQYKAAAEMYTLAIDGGKRTFNTYFNRGACLAECCDPMVAAADFTRAMELQRSDSALYMRAVCYVKGNAMRLAIADLDTLLQRNELFPHALALRGQAAYASGDRAAACADFARAAVLGDTQAVALRRERCDTAGFAHEGIVIEWPKDRGPWKQVDQRDDSTMSVVVLRREREIGKDWTELGMMTSMKRVYRAHPDTVMTVLFNESKKQATSPALTVLEHGVTEGRPWVIFCIEAGSWTTANGQPESQIYYVVQGRTALYIVHRDTHAAQLKPAEKKLWTSVFRKTRLTQK